MKKVPTHFRAEQNRTVMPCCIQNYGKLVGCLLLSVKSEYLLLIHRAAPGVHQRGACGGGREGGTAETGHRGVPSNRRDVRQLKQG